MTDLDWYQTAYFKQRDLIIKLSLQITDMRRCSNCKYNCTCVFSSRECDSNLTGWEWDGDKQ